MHDPGFDVEAMLRKLEEQQEEQDERGAPGSYVADFYLINGAEREFNGHFGTWSGHEFYHDGRIELSEVHYLQCAKEISTLTFDINDMPLRLALEQVPELRFMTDQLEYELVAFARGAGWSWSNIGRKLGVTGSTVHRRYAQIEVASRVRRPISRYD